MSAFNLKILAVIAMLIDHIGVVTFYRYPSDFQDFFHYARYIGRIAFPIFAFLIANGCVHTKNINKYMFRLGCLALISEIPFDLVFMDNINFLRHTNIFYTLFLGVASIEIYERIKRKKQQWLILLPFLAMPATLLVNFIPLPLHGLSIARVVVALCVAATFYFAYKLPEIEDDREIGIKNKLIPILSFLPLIALAELMNTDYGNFGVGLIVLLYLSNPQNKITRTIALLAGLIFFYGRNIFTTIWRDVDGQFVVERVISSQAVFTFAFSLIAVILIFFYNNNLGTKSLAFKWSFYAFYPIHIIILGIIRIIYLS